MVMKAGVPVCGYCCLLMNQMTLGRFSVKVLMESLVLFVVAQWYFGECKFNFDLIWV